MEKNAMEKNAIVEYMEKRINVICGNIIASTNYREAVRRANVSIFALRDYSITERKGWAIAIYRALWVKACEDNMPEFVFSELHRRITSCHNA